mmetsp:Transcript_33783/g.81010  ORF Transcript_33783/g.81010 Transcript_33783/m.81010 type:complete len:163 (+) Transcript_33783:3-491(+)
MIAKPWLRVVKSSSDLHIGPVVGSTAMAKPTHRFEFQINGQKYSFDTVKSDVEKQSLPPYQGFAIILGPATVPLQEHDEVRDFTIYQVETPDEKKIFSCLKATELLQKLNTPHRAGTRPSGETYEEWAEWEKTSRTSITFASFDINARDVPGSGYYRMVIGS